MKGMNTKLNFDFIKELQSHVSNYFMHHLVGSTPSVPQENGLSNFETFFSVMR